MSIVEDFLALRKRKLILAKKYSAPRELSLEEAKQIDPRFNERLGKIYMNVYGDITVEHPYPGHRVQAFGTLVSHHIIIDGVEISDPKELSAYWYGEK